VASYVIRYTKIHNYSGQSRGIVLPVTLRAGTRAHTVPASLDTGASQCLFARVHAEVLGLNVESGEHLTFTTANSRFDAFGHELTFEVLGMQTTSMVFFFADPAISKNVLGRQGWLDRVRIGLVDYDRVLYVAQYDEAAS